ncbi:MAG: hypothetical protein CBB77_02790 [Hyphomonas sp. TMED17]|nr:MAG: hypothetical protein CBB77_02790 [Hyphomonas sp. TMED17]
MPSDLRDWTILIDLDGTLVDTAPDLHAALNHVLARQNLRVIPLQALRHMVGDGAKAMIRKGLDWNGVEIDEEKIDNTLWPQFIEHYVANICHHSRPFEGAVSAIDALIEAGAKIAICTNKAQALAEELIASLDLNTRIAAIIGGDVPAYKKPDPDHIRRSVRAVNGDLKKTLLIGDSTTDERAALAAGIAYIYVSFGYGEFASAITSQIRRVDAWQQIPGEIAGLTGV